MNPRGLTVAAVLTILGGGCREVPPAVFTDLKESRRLAAELRVQFAKATDASSRAVVADTDQSAAANAREAKHFKEAVKQAVDALTPRLERVDQAEATSALEAFDRQFAGYDQVDREMLKLVVENTNLKAQRLTFGPGREAADAFRDSVAAVAASAAPRDRCRADGQAAVAVAAVREIEVLWAPHIAEADDAVMTRLEARITTLEGQARGNVAALSAVRPAAAASAALDRFVAVSTEVVALSRRNTHVRSLELALRRRPALVGACDESLRTLGDALAKDLFPATR